MPTPTPDVPRGSSENETVLTYLRQLLTDRYWGSVSMKIEAGNIVFLREEKNLKPSELLPRLNRSQHANTRLTEQH